eukprot:10759036-Alexandrium_andersonii.AAC.1
MRRATLSAGWGGDAAAVCGARPRGSCASGPDVGNGRGGGGEEGPSPVRKCTEQALPGLMG